MNVSLNEINQLLEGTLVGDGETRILALSPIDNITSQSLVFADSERYLAIAEQSAAAAIIVAETVSDSTKPLIRVQNPVTAFTKLLEHFHPPQAYPSTISERASIADDVIIGKNVHIAAGVSIGTGCRIGDDVNLLANAVIGRDVEIGNHCTIHPNVCLYDRVIIGNHVNIHAGSVVGSDGFGYHFIDGRHQKTPHVGNVIIEDQVEIGANTVIDRATMGSTVIGHGTKIDNLVQVAHSVKLGQHNILCAFTGIAGSSTTGDHVVCAANVGISDHVTIGDRTILGARTGIPPKKKIPQDSQWLGSPARPMKKTMELKILEQRLPQMRDDIKALKAKLKALEKEFSD